MSDVDYEVIVIGAGGGGLAAATRLSLAGKKVLLIEQHSKVGGYMSSFERGDYTFEVSLHAINGLDPETGGPAGAAHTRFAVGNQTVKLHHAGSHQWHRRQKNPGGITTRIAN